MKMVNLQDHKVILSLMIIKGMIAFWFCPLCLVRLEDVSWIKNIPDAYLQLDVSIIYLLRYTILLLHIIAWFYYIYYASVIAPNDRWYWATFSMFMISFVMQKYWHKFIVDATHDDEEQTRHNATITTHSVKYIKKPELFSNNPYKALVVIYEIAILCVFFIIVALLSYQQKVKVMLNITIATTVLQFVQMIAMWVVTKFLDCCTQALQRQKIRHNTYRSGERA